MIAVKGLLTSLRHILRKHGGTASDPVALYGLIFSKRRLTSASVTGENSCRSGTLGKGMGMGNQSVWLDHIQNWRKCLLGQKV